MNPFSHLEDEKLIKLYQEDEFLAFEVLYQRHKDRVYSYIAKRTPKESDRDEIFQNTFLKVHKSKHTYKDKYLFLQWLYTVARSELLDYCKKKKVEYIEYDDNQYATEVRNDDFDLSEYKSLNDKEREALKLKFYSDEDYEEISVALNTSKANARKLISRALAKVRKGLTGDKS